MASSLIVGLQYIPNYLNTDEQANLLAIIDRQPWLTDLKRRVQHYGYKYDYKNRAINATSFLGKLPEWAANLAEKLHSDGYSPIVPDQVIVNEYDPGQGISSHIDCAPCFGDTILSISLGSTCVMEFSKQKIKIPILLEPGSLVVMQGESRYQWKHAIPARKTDVFDGQSIKRGRRVSLTLRNVIRE